LKTPEQLTAMLPVQPALVQPSSPLKTPEQLMAMLPAQPAIVPGHPALVQQLSSPLKTPEQLMAELPPAPPVLAPTSANKVQQFSPDELNMVNVMNGVPDDIQIVPTSMPAAKGATAPKRPAAGLLQSGSGAGSVAMDFQQPSFDNPQMQTGLAVSPTFIPPPPFYDALPTASPDGGGGGSYSRPQASLMLTDADLAADYKKGFNTYVSKQPVKDRMVSLYPTPGAAQALPSLDALATNPMASPDIVMPDMPLEPPPLPMGGGGIGGMGGIPGSASFSLIQQPHQHPGGDNVEELLKKNDEALKKHFGSQKGLSSTRPALALLQGAGEGLGGQQRAIAGGSADLLMQQAQYQDWFKQNQDYQKRYASNFKTGDAVDTMKSRMAMWANVQEQQKAIDAEIVDSMHSSSTHKGKRASMIRINSNVNHAMSHVAQQQYNARVAQQEKELWGEYHHLEQVQKELAQEDKNYKKLSLKTQEEEQLYAARTRQTGTLWQNMAKQQQGPPGFFLGPN